MEYFGNNPAWWYIRIIVQSEVVEIKLTLLQGNDDPTHFVSVYEVHRVDTVHLVRHVAGYKGDTLLTL